MSTSPGPWTFTRMGNQIVSSNGHVVCWIAESPKIFCEDETLSQEQMDAEVAGNRAAVVATPEVLAALEDTEAALSEIYCVYGLTNAHIRVLLSARAAIARVKGVP